MPKMTFTVLIREAGQIIWKQVFKTRKKADKLIDKLKLKGLDVLFF